MKKRDKAVLILEDGSWFQGEQLGFQPTNGAMGEVVFNTSFSGYQEIITDPSYKGQIICFTYPSIGNYGINEEDMESARPFLQAIILKDYCENPSNFRSKMTLEDYMIKEKIPGINDVDTRALVRHIREKGSIRGGIFKVSTEINQSLIDQFVAKIKNEPLMEGQNLAADFDGKDANKFVESYIQNKKMNTQNFAKVAVLDFGIKFSILINLLNANLYPVVFPGDTELANWKNYNEKDFSGFFLSNGPGDPAEVKNGIKNIQTILNYKKPVLGICLGHQMLSIALGAETYKLKFGHHGGNQPVKKRGQNKVIITAQNHGFAVKEPFFQTSLFKNPKSTVEVNTNDNTIEGFTLFDQKIISVQYHPEAGPGPNDALSVFQEFRSLINH